MRRSFRWTSLAILACALGSASLLPEKAPLSTLRASAADWPAKDQPDLAALAAAAPALKAENLGQPVKSARLDENYLVPKPDGKGYDLVQVYQTGPTLVVADLSTGKAKVVVGDRSCNLHIAPSVIAPNGTLYISGLGIHLHQEICTYDPATGELKLRAIKMPDDLFGETHPMAVGTDGKIYCAGAHPSKSATVTQIDPATNQVTDYGPIGPSHAPSDCWAMSVAADDRYIYVASGKVPYYVIAYDRQTGQSETLLTTEREGGSAGVGQGKFGCTAAASRLVGGDAGDKRQGYWLYQGKAIPRKDPRETPPWPEPKEVQKAPLPKPEISTAAAVPDVHGEATIWYRLPENKPAKPKPTAKAAAKEPAGKGEEAADKAPEAVPDDAAMEAEGWRPIRYTVPVFAMGISRVFELPDGHIMGTAGAYEGNFFYDPRTGKLDHPGKCHLSHYATAILDGKVYMSGYPSSALFVFDPSKPWTNGMRIGGTKVLAEDDPQSNPRQLCRLAESGAHKMYAAAVANGKIYFGGRWYRNGEQGGLGWYDPATGTHGGFWEPFVNHQINYITAADGGRLIVISAHRVADTITNKPKPEQGALFFLDTATDKLIGEKWEPFPKIRGPGPIVCVGGPRVIGWTENTNDPTPAKPHSSLLYGFDAITRQVLFTKVIPFPMPVKIGSNQEEPWDFRLGPDGMIWTFISDKTLVRIDPKDASLSFVGNVPAGRLAFEGKDIYLSGLLDLRVVRGGNPYPAK